MPSMPNASDATNNTTKTMDELVALVESLQSRLQNRDATIRLLVEQVRLLRHKSFGRLSEGLSPDQLAMLFNEAASAAAAGTDTVADHCVAVIDTATRRKPGGRRHLPPALPRVIVTHDLTDAEKVCPKDGSALHRIGEVVTEQLDIVPMRIQVIRHVRHS